MSVTPPLSTAHVDPIPGTTHDSREAAFLLAGEEAVDAGVRIMRRGQSHIGAVVAKGDRGFATAVDIRIESVIKASLADATPDIPFLGEERGGDVNSERGGWLLDPIDGTVNFARGSPLCTISLSLVLAAAELFEDPSVARSDGSPRASFCWPRTSCMKPSSGWSTAPTRTRRRSRSR
jgi:hypothetical protein